MKIGLMEKDPDDSDANALFIQILDSGFSLFQQEFSCLNAQGIHGPGVATLAQQLYDIGVTGHIAQAQTWNSIGLAERMENDEVGDVHHLASLQQGFAGVCLVRLVDDKGVTRRAAHHIVQESLHQHITGRVVGITYPVDAVARQLCHFVVVFVRDDVTILPTGVSILVERWLGNDRSTAMKMLGYEIDGLGSTIRYQNSLWRDAFAEGDEAFQTARLGLRIIGYQVERILQVQFECRQVGMLIDIAAEVHLHQIVVAVNVVSVAF